MKVASTVLGIVGGILALLFAALFVLLGVLLGNVAADALEGRELHLDGREYELPFGRLSADDDSVCFETDHFIFEMKDVSEISGRAVAAGDDIVRITLIVIACLSALGGVLGITGGALARRPGTSAGTTMLIAAFFSIFTVIGAVAALLLLVGAALSLIPQRKPKAPQPAPKQS